MAGNNPGPLAPHEFCYHVRKAPSYHNDFTDLARLILDATSVVTVKADNMEWYGELEQPKAGKDQHKTQESDFLKEYQKFQESVWGDVRTLDDETGLLFQVLQHWKEYRRKWGPGGVFTELEDFYPEHRAEIGRNFDMHQEIINAEDALWTQWSRLVAGRGGVLLKLSVETKDVDGSFRILTYFSFRKLLDTWLRK